MEALQRAEYEEPTPIQRVAIPTALSGVDLVGIAVTGSGKTAAYVIPMVVYVKSLPPMTHESALNGPYALVMAPTRELAQQISEECEKFAKPLGIRAVSVVGGVDIQEQGFLLREGAEIVICTPGRLVDCLERRLVVLNQCNYVVLDEADRMIEMNFEKDVTRILDSMPASNLKPENPDEMEDGKKRYRQTIMFSATMPQSVDLLTRQYLRRYIRINIGSRSGKKAIVLYVCVCSVWHANAYQL